MSSVCAESGSADGQVVSNTDGDGQQHHVAGHAELDELLPSNVLDTLVDL